MVASHGYLIRGTLLPSSFSSSKRRNLLPFFIVALVCWEGCASAPKPPSPVAIQVARIETALNSIAASYQKKDPSRLSLHLSPAFLGRSLLQEQIERDIATFSEIKVKMQLNRVEMTNEIVWTSIYWEGTWTIPGKEPLMASGQALFGWNTDDPPRLLEIRGDPPWGMGRAPNGEGGRGAP